MKIIKKIRSIIQSINQIKYGFFTLEVLIGLGIIILGTIMMTNKFISIKRSCINNMSIAYIETILVECDISNISQKYENPDIGIKLEYKNQKLHIRCNDESLKNYLINYYKNYKIKDNIIFD